MPVVLTAGSEMKVQHSKNLLHVTNPLYKVGIFVQMCWTYCNKTSNFQSCQYHTLIRILPEEPNCFHTKIPRSVVNANALRACPPSSRSIPNKANHFRVTPFSSLRHGENARSPR
jgi:hypothetical protein